MPSRIEYTYEETLQLELAATSGNSDEFNRVCALFKRSPKAVVNRLNQKGLTILAQRPWSAWELHPPGTSPLALAGELGVPRSTLYLAMETLGIHGRQKNEGGKKRLSDLDKKKLTDWFSGGAERKKLSRKNLEKARGGKTLHQVSADFSCDVKRVRRMMGELRIRPRRSGRYIILLKEDLPALEKKFRDELQVWGRCEEEIWECCVICKARGFEAESPSSHGSHGCCMRCTRRAYRRLSSAGITDWTQREFQAMAAEILDFRVKCGACGTEATRNYHPKRLNRYYPSWLCEKCRSIAHNRLRSFPEGERKLTDHPPEFILRLASKPEA